MSSKKWKEYLLKSSLPMEQNVAEIVNSHGLHVRGEFPYTRINENKVPVEFSIDINAGKLIKIRNNPEAWASLDILIECKYNSPGIDWLFTRYPNLEPICSNSIQDYDLFSTYWLWNKESLVEIEKNALYTISGLSIGNDTIDNNKIKHGLSQLRYSIPAWLERTASIELRDESAHSIPLVVPILVTTAPLRVLKSNVTFSDVHNASDLNDISTIHDVVYHYQEAGPSLSKYYQEKSSEIVNNYNNEKRDIRFNQSHLYDELINNSETIAIVNLNYLPNYLKTIMLACNSLGVLTTEELLDKFNNCK